MSRWRRCSHAAAGVVGRGAGRLRPCVAHGRGRCGRSAERRAAAEHAGEHGARRMPSIGADAAVEPGSAEESKPIWRSGRSSCSWCCWSCSGKFAWGPIIAGAREARARHRRRTSPQAERKPRGGQAAAGRVRAEAGRRGRRSPRACWKRPAATPSTPSRRSWPKAKADAEAETAAGAARDRDGHRRRRSKELAETSADLAVELAGKIVQAKLTPADHARLIHEAMAKFPGNAASTN